MVRHAQNIVNTNAAAPRDRLPTKPSQIHKRLNLRGGHWQGVTIMATLLLLSSILLVLLLA